MDQEASSVTYSPIGVLRTPWSDPVGMPGQPVAAKDARGVAMLRAGLAQGLADLSLFTHAVLLYHFHCSKPGYDLSVVPFADTSRRGVFATRAPRRPNPIGMSVVEIVRVDVERGEVEFRGADVLDNTPLLDIKPYVPMFDDVPHASRGWFQEQVDLSKLTADGRFQ
eukprot:m51a1_g5703 hypothetical protein (167) ;mRNA; f:1061535-1062035